MGPLAADPRNLQIVSPANDDGPAASAGLRPAEPRSFAPAEAAPSSTPLPVFDEMHGFGQGVRPPWTPVADWLDRLGPGDLGRRTTAAESLFRRQGVTFAVYGEAAAEERIIPMDLIPRVIAAEEWQAVEVGATQRVRALNAFLADVYGEQACLRAGVVPPDLILSNPAFRSEMIGLPPPGGVFTHVSGVDLVRTGETGFQVLEDNVRTPSGVSYMLKNREMTARLCPELLAASSVRPVDDYPARLHAALRACAPASAGDDPLVVVLTPGGLNSAYYEHLFLAERMGAPLVTGADLFVEDDQVWMRTLRGPVRVDVVYRRIDDDFLDPDVFRPDSALGVPGLMRAYAAGCVTLANAPGTGIADDKAVYTYVPDLIRFYLGEAPRLDNVPTWRCREPDHLKAVLDRLDTLVVKAVDGSGGYGMLIGPASTRAEIENFRARLMAAPQNYIAQPTLALSTAPTADGDVRAARHVDLRPFVVLGPDGASVTPGGLTRVALKPGSLVVNSSQGGGGKDTWVLAR
jgi:uncharacterized circularly permuted ATP-grasp superfamily protein